MSLPVPPASRRQPGEKGLKPVTAFNRLNQAAAASLGVLLLLAVASVPLSPGKQAIVGVGGATAFLICNRFRGKPVTVFLAVLSVAVSTRYIVWRLTSTLGLESYIELGLAAILLSAELYAVTVLILGYVQTLWPLERTPVPLPDNPGLWPTVDVFVPTYNESLDIVRTTVLGALNIDWPRDKLNVHILDDGRREEFRAFAAACGVSYITRTDNKHAKAGNINNALARTRGEFILIFDCDHIPTRAFLQMTMGWMVRDSRLAMVQTPHHFYSPDPFQRNLAAGTRVPPEGNLFYGLIQPGNDFWNASFFCGSCAVLRRSALAEIGGIATETVTEDAHTMLKLHRRGWDSAYLALPLAGGLATERLILHVGQRMRWARGMIQIFRTDNPLLGPGLSWGQRLCYVQATGHFFFAVPRVVFLGAPLLFLLLNQNIIAASPLAIVAYALPHIFHSVATNSRLQRNWRHSFWSEIYETTLALFLVRMTLVTLLFPKKGKFNVTAKGGVLENGYLDFQAVYPNIIFGVILITGILRGVGQIALVPNDELTFQALLLNSIWATLSLLTVFASLAVGRESRQWREFARVNATIPVVVYLPQGRVIEGVTQDLSQTGANLNFTAIEGLAAGDPVDLEFEVGGEKLVLSGAVKRLGKSRVSIEYNLANVEDEAKAIQVTFGRADAWAKWSEYPADRPLRSLWNVLISIAGLLRRGDKPTRLPAIAENSAVPSASSRSRLGRRSAKAAISALLALALLPLGTSKGAHAQAPVRHKQSGDSIIRTAPAVGDSLGGSLNPPLPPAEIKVDAPNGSMESAASGDPVPAPTGPSKDAASAPQATTFTRQAVYTLRELGATGPLQLRGTSELQGVQFGIRSDEVVVAAKLKLAGAMSPSLIPEVSNDTVSLNDQFIGVVPADSAHARFSDLVLPINPAFFKDDNRLNFRFSGRYTRDCNDPLSGLLWSTIYDNSTLTLTIQKVMPRRELARLPQPFFDPHDRLSLTLPFVVPGETSNQSFRASGIVASWFGQMADYRTAKFPVLRDAPPEGNGVVVGTTDELPVSLQISAVNGPTLGVVPNPNDSLGSLLIVTGRSSADLVAAASALVLGSRALGGSTASVSAPAIVSRKPYDAPYWIPTNRPVQFGELVGTSNLQTAGYTPSPIHVPFRTSPDLYTWRNRPFTMDVRYQAPPGPIVDVAVSRFDASLNGAYLGSRPLASGPGWMGWLTRWLALQTPGPEVMVAVPSYYVFGQNDLEFFFDARPLHRGECVAVPSAPRMSIDPQSTIDLSAAYHFAELPNLAYFVNSGFPFTRMADLSETAVVLSDRPSAAEEEAFLELMGRVGTLTGNPVTGVAIVRPSEVNAVADRDLLVLTTFHNLQTVPDLLRVSPVRPSGDMLQVEMSDTLPGISLLFGDLTRKQRERAQVTLAAATAADTAVLLGTESPFRHGRSLVAFLATSPDGLKKAVTLLSDSTKVSKIQGDLTILSGGTVSSYRVGSTYTVGHLSFWVWATWYLRDSPFAILGLLVIGSIFVSLVWLASLRRRAEARLRHIGQ